MVADHVFKPDLMPQSVGNLTRNIWTHNRLSLKGDVLEGGVQKSDFVFFLLCLQRFRFEGNSQHLGLDQDDESSSFDICAV